MTFFQLIQDHRRSCIWYSDDLFFTNLCLNPQIHFSSFWRPKYLFLFIGNLLETVLSNFSGKKISITYYMLLFFLFQMKRYVWSSFKKFALVKYEGQLILIVAFRKINPDGKTITNCYGQYIFILEFSKYFHIIFFYISILQYL